MKKGVLVASDADMEWLLPWWWERYECCNSFPVAFVDLGMTKKARAWCEERGQVLAVTDKIAEDFIEDTSVAEWKETYGESYVEARKAWFKKPLACLLSPFDKTVWMDLDCEILSSIEPIFNCLEEGKEVAIALDRIPVIPDGFAPNASLKKMPVFNGGVIVYLKGSEVMRKWAQTTLTESHLYWGDDYVLSSVIYELQDKVEVLPSIYNWRFADGAPFYAKIIHWCGEWGKAYIANKGGFKVAIEGFPELKKVFGLT